MLKHSKERTTGAADGCTCAKTLQILGSKASAIPAVVTDTTVTTVVTVTTVATVGFLVNFLKVLWPPITKKKHLFTANLSNAAGLRGTQHATELEGIQHHAASLSQASRLHIW